MKKLYRLVLALPILLTSACDFGNTNIDPSRLSDAPVNQILPAAQAQTARNLGSVGARVSGVVIQHFQGIDAQPLAYNTYLIDETALDDFWRTGLYVGAMKDCHVILEKGESANIPQYTGIAKVLMAVNLGIATSFWGDVPYSETMQGQDNLKPVYDTQEEIYETIQTLLDEAIEELNQDPGEINPGLDDLIFGGNRAFWIGSARALKARYFMHLTAVDTEASAKALGALSGGTIFSNEVQPNFPFGLTQNEANPIAFFGQDRANQLVISPHLLGVLDDTADPRKEYYTRLVNGNQVIYVRNDQMDDDTDLYWGQFESPMPLISYSELLFIRAEANHRLGIASLAQSNLDMAVRKNMEVMGIADTLISEYLVDNTDLSTLLTDDEKLERIIEQKHIAMFGQGAIEAWVDYRRTGYPVLAPSSEASESFNPSKVIPERYLYPISEQSTNTTNVEAAIERQGGHLLDQPLWAFE